MKKTAISILALTLCALYSITPLLIHEEFISGGWDLSTHISKAMQVSAGIREGIIYPRWLPMSNGGYGSPTMIFYSPLFYWVTGVINLFIPSLIVSLKVSTFLGFLLSGLSMYIFLRNFCNNTGSLAGGIAYQLMPYHIFNLYWRETLAETFAFFWFPLILHFAYKWFTEHRPDLWIGLAFSYAGLVLTHIVTAYIFTFVIAGTALFLSLREKSFKVLLWLMLAVSFGLSISAVYFIPMFFERRFVHVEWLQHGPWDYARSFLYITENSLNPFYIHVEHIVMMQVLLVAVSLMLIYYRNSRYGKPSNLYQIVFFSVLFAFSLFISTPLSMPIWEYTPGLSTTLFPWRWLMISTLATSVLIGLTFDTFSFADIKRDRFIRVSMAVFHAIVISSLYLASFYIMTADTMKKSDLERMGKGGVLIEYRPIWLTDMEKDFSSENWMPVIFKEGEGTVEVIRWRSQSRLFKVNTVHSSRLRVSTFYYPGWTALISGKEIPIGIEKDSGAMLLSLPPGENIVSLEFRDTPLRKGGKWVSLISLFAAFFTMVMGRQKRRTSIKMVNG